MKKKIIAFAALLTIIAFSSHVQGDVIVFMENFDDPDVGVLGTSNVTLTEITDPTDASNTVGEIVIDGATNFVNINTNSAVPEPLPANTTNLTFSLDYLVPTGGAGTAMDFLFLQLQFFDNAGTNLGNFNSNFPTLDTASAALDTFQPLSVTAAAPTGAVSFTGLAIAGDFSNDSTAGTIFLVDNIVVDAVVAIPEPTSLALLGLLGATVFCRRRR